MGETGNGLQRSSPGSLPCKWYPSHFHRAGHPCLCSFCLVSDRTGESYCRAICGVQDLPVHTEMSSWPGLRKLVPFHAIVVSEHHSLPVPTSYCSPCPLHPLGEYPQRVCLVRHTGLLQYPPSWQEYVTWKENSFRSPTKSILCGILGTGDRGHKIQCLGPVSLQPC